MKPTTRARICYFILVIPALISACGRKPATEAGAFFSGRDLAGRKVVIPIRPSRIISLAPSNTETVFALGAGDRLEGRTNVCDFPPAAHAVTPLGDLGRISLEKIVGRSPDLVLAGNKTDPEALAILSRMGIPTAVTEATTIEETYRSILLIGSMTGTPAGAEDLVEKMRAKITTIADRTRGADKPLVYYVVGFGQGGNWTAGPGSFIDEMITLSGGRNAAADLGRPWGLFQLEKIIALEPDIILAGRHTGPPELLKTEPGYRGLSAIKHNRLVIIDDDLVNRPGPRLAQGLREVARALHPDLFPEEDD